MKFAGLALASLAMLASGAAAQAAQRYAAPGGTGPETECPQANPCSLGKAIGGAKSNDEVIVTSGTYTLSAQAIMSFEATDVDIHGEFGGAMPAIKGSFAGAVIAAYGPRARVRYLETVNEAPGNPAGINCTTEGVVERVVARVSGKNAAALLQQNNCAVRDSLLLADGEGAIALRGSSFFPGHTSVTRNVTAIASGPESIGVFARYETAFPLPSSYRLDLKNSIAAGDGADILASSGAEGPGNVIVSNSNFDSVKQEAPATITDAGANQTSPPLFVNATAGDYHEAAGSPTIDGGIADEVGPLDLAGGVRILGAAPDIGAFEFVPLPKAIPLVAQLQSLKVAPSSFRAAKSGGAFASASKTKAKGPLGTTVTYTLSAGGTLTVKFSVEKLTTGRKTGKKCVAKTRTNESHKKCTLAKPVKGGFTSTGVAGQNKLKFSGRIANRALAPGRYQLVGSAGGSVKRATFTIVG